MDDYDKAKLACEKATRAYNIQVKKCKLRSKEYADQKRKCNAYQGLMDAAACKRAVLVKDVGMIY